MEKEVKLTIQIKTMDLFHFFMKHFYSGFSGIFGIILSVGALLLFAFGFGKWETYQLLLLLVLGVLFTVIQPVQFWLKAWQQVKLMPIYKEAISYSLDEGGIHVRQNEEALDLEWDKIQKVTESGKGIYIYTSPVHSFIFPKEQLAGEQEAVRTFLKEKVSGENCKLK